MTHTTVNVDLSDFRMRMMEGKEDFSRKASECVRKLGYTLEKHMKKAAPVKTGRLRSSIKTKFGKTQYVSMVSPHTHYAEKMDKVYGYIGKAKAATDQEAQKIAEAVFSNWVVQAK